MPAGWMSRAWAVRDGNDLYVARLVDGIARQPFETGLAAAAYLRENGIVIGEPVRNLAGSLTAADPGGTVGLVRRVPGDLLDGADPLDQQGGGGRLGPPHPAPGRLTPPG